MIVDEPAETGVRTPAGATTWTDDEWYPLEDLRHRHVSGCREYVHAHPGGAVAHRWQDHTEAEASLPDPEIPTDPLVAAREWLDERRLTPLPGSDAAEAIGHLDAVVGYVDDALANLVRGGVESAYDMSEILRPAESEGTRRVQLRVEYADHSRCFYPVPEGEGWKIDAGTRTLVIGRGLGREVVPLDRVHSFSPEAY